MCVPVLKCHQLQLRPPDPPPGALPPGPSLGALPPDPRYRLALPRSPYCELKPTLVFFPNAATAPQIKFPATPLMYIGGTELPSIVDVGFTTRGRTMSPYSGQDAPAA